MHNYNINTPNSQYCHLSYHVQEMRIFVRDNVNALIQKNYKI